MPKFTVHKQVINVYAVEVEADNPTDAVIQAYNNEEEDAQLVDDYSANETQWEVFVGDSMEPLQTNPFLIERAIHGN